MTLEEKELLMFPLSEAHSLQHVAVSNRFKDSKQNLLANSLPTAWPVLKDAYLAYASLLKSLQPSYASALDGDYILRNVSSAMVVLHNLTIHELRDAEVCLALGFALSGAIAIGLCDHWCRRLRHMSLLP